MEPFKHQMTLSFISNSRVRYCLDDEFHSISYQKKQIDVKKKYLSTWITLSRLRSEENRLRAWYGVIIIMWPMCVCNFRSSSEKKKKSNNKTAFSFPFAPKMRQRAENVYLHIYIIDRIDIRQHPAELSISSVVVEMWLIKTECRKMYSQQNGKHISSSYFNLHEKLHFSRTLKR